MACLLQFTINVLKSPLSTSVPLCNSCRVLFVSVDIHVCLCRQQHPNCDIANGQSAVSTFVLLTSLLIHPHKQKPKGVRYGNSSSSISATIQNYTHVHVTVFLTMADTITSQKFAAPPESPCIVSQQ